MGRTVLMLEGVAALVKCMSACCSRYLATHCTPDDANPLAVGAMRGHT
jgi:hypothetical protein